MTAEIEVYEDVSDYNRYMGENADRSIKINGAWMKAFSHRRLQRI